MTEFKYIYDDLKENVMEDYVAEIAYQLKRIADIKMRDGFA